VEGETIAFSDIVLTILIVAPPAIFAITCHEVAHGWVASRYGDPTAQMQGRLTLNPLPHVDPVGTIVVPVVLALASAPIIGWAKPVPVNFRNLRHPKKHMGLVAAAGPGTNLLLAALCGLLLNVIILAFPVNVTPEGAPTGGAAGGFFAPLVEMLVWGLRINVMLAIFNLLPIPPMDGSKVAISVLPMPYAGWFLKLEQLGFLPLLILFFIPATRHAMASIVFPIADLLTKLFIGLPSLIF
jgi:Zn-dependent protease